MTTTRTRTAEVTGPNTEAFYDTITRYLPGNYGIVAVKTVWDDEGNQTDQVTLVIEGEDSCGWTLDEYVIPRLASGLYFAKETTQDLGAHYRDVVTAPIHLSPEDEVVIADLLYPDEGCACLNCGETALQCEREFQASQEWCCGWCRANGAQAAHQPAPGLEMIARPV